MSTGTESPVVRATATSRLAAVLLRSGVLLSIAVFFANVSNYLFQVMAGRLLGPDEYGLLSSVFTLVAIVGVSASSLQAATAKGEAIRREGLLEHTVPEVNGLIRDPLVRLAFGAGLALGIGVLVLSPLLGRFFHSSTGPVLGFAALVPSLGVLAVVYGRLQGLQRFVSFSVLSLGLAVGKLGLGALAIEIDLGVTGVIFVLAGLGFVGALTGLVLTRHAAILPMTEVGNDVARALIAFTFFWTLLSIDTVVARHWFSADDAGQYAAAAVIGKGILWLPDVVALVVFPQLATAVRAGTDSRRLLGQAVVLAASLCLAGCFALWAVGPFVFRHLYGTGYEEAAGMSWKLGLVSLPFAIANLLIFYHLARPGWAWLVPLGVAGVLELSGFLLLHDSGNQLIAVTAVASLVLMLSLAIGVWIPRSRSSLALS